MPTLRVTPPSRGLFVLSLALAVWSVNAVAQEPLREDDVDEAPFPVDAVSTTTAREGEAAPETPDAAATAPPSLEVAEGGPSAPMGTSPTGTTESEMSARAKRKILVLTPASDESMAKTAESVAQLVAAKTASYPTFEVITASDVTRLLDLEADRQVMGCDTTSCAAEVAEAMGASLVIFGEVSRLGAVVIVTLSLYDSETANPIARVVAQTRDEHTLPGALDPKLEEMLARLPDAGEPTLTLTNVSLDDGPGLWPWTVAGGGTLVFVAGVLVGLVVASIPYVLALGALGDANDALEAPRRTEDEVGQSQDIYTSAHDTYALAQQLEAPMLAASAVSFLVAMGGLGVAVGGISWALTSGEEE